MLNLTDDLKAQASRDFEAMYQLKPKELHKIQTKFVELECKRYQKSYLNTPLISWFKETDENQKKKFRRNYMFSGLNDSQNRESLPEIFMPYLQYVNQIFEEPFNQVSINWYDDGSQYIPLHVDCEEFMGGDKSIAILTFNENDEEARDLVLKRFDDKTEIKIPLLHGSIFTLTSEMQKIYKHGIRKDDSKGRRISLSFRKFEEAKNL